MGGLKPRHMLAWQVISVKLTSTQFPTQNLDSGGSSAVNLTWFYYIINSFNRVIRGRPDFYPLKLEPALYMRFPTTGSALILAVGHQVWVFSETVCKYSSTDTNFTVMGTGLGSCLTPFSPKMNCNKTWGLLWWGILSNHCWTQN